MNNKHYGVLVHASSKPVHGLANWISAWLTSSDSGSDIHKNRPRRGNVFPNDFSVYFCQPSHRPNGVEPFFDVLRDQAYSDEPCREFPKCYCSTLRRRLLNHRSRIHSGMPCRFTYTRPHLVSRFYHSESPNLTSALRSP